MTLNKLSVHPTEFSLLNPNNVNLPVNINNFSSNSISPSDNAKTCCNFSDRNVYG